MRENSETGKSYRNGKPPKKLIPIKFEISEAFVLTQRDQFRIQRENALKKLPLEKQEADKKRNQLSILPKFRISVFNLSLTGITCYS